MKIWIQPIGALLLKYRKVLAILSMLPICLMITAFPASVLQALSQSETPDSSGICSEMSPEVRIEYSIPSDFTEFKYIPPLEIRSSNTVVGRFVENGWDGALTDQILGKPEERYAQGVSFQITDSALDDYAGKIFFLFFNNSYSREVLDGINLRNTKRDILGKLGPPQFEDKNLRLFGYKAKLFYVFFSGEADLESITVYRRDTDHDKDLILRRMNGEIYDRPPRGNLWHDVDVRYAGYRQRYEYMSIGAVDDAEFGKLEIYNNFEGRITVDVSLPEDYRKIIDNAPLFINKNDGYYSNIDFEFKPETDLVFLYECDRSIKKAGVIDEINTRGILSPDQKKAIVYYQITAGDTHFSVFHLDGSQPEIQKYSYYLEYIAWLNDRYIAYYNQHDEICVFDIVEQKTRVVDKNDAYSDGSRKIISSDKGKLVFDISGQGQFEYPYSFDDGGRIAIGERRQINK